MKTGIYYLQYEDHLLPLLNDDFVYWLELDALCEILHLGDPAPILARLDADQHRQISNSFGVVYSFIGMDVVYELILDPARKRRTRAFRRWLSQTLSPAGPKSFTRRPWVTFGAADEEPPTPATSERTDRRPVADLEDSERVRRRPALAEEPYMNPPMEGRRPMSPLAKDPAEFPRLRHAAQLYAAQVNSDPLDEANLIVGMYLRLVDCSTGGRETGGRITWPIVHSITRGAASRMVLLTLAECGVLSISEQGVDVTGVITLDVPEDRQE